MRGMEVHLNGEKLCIAGVGKTAVLNAIVNVIGRKGDFDMTVRVGGLENDEFLTWALRAFELGMKSRSELWNQKRSIRHSS